ncbi:MAG TPA: hypothetical protein VEK31_12085 [Xanthobacteraceae bacterium]|nr:hypothetical protein [Xanthobacteraceae bacterium]
MNVAKSLDYTEIGKPSETGAEENIQELTPGGAAVHPVESGGEELSAAGLSKSLRRLSETSAREIENLVGELQTLRRKLQIDGNRIQRDIEEYAELTQQVMRLTTIISDSVKKLPEARGVRH